MAAKLPIEVSDGSTFLVFETPAGDVKLRAEAIAIRMDGEPGAAILAWCQQLQPKRVEGLCRRCTLWVTTQSKLGCDVATCPKKAESFLPAAQSEGAGSEAKGAPKEGA